MTLLSYLSGQVLLCCMADMTVGMQVGRDLAVPVKKRFASNCRMLSTVIDNKSVLQSVIIVPLMLAQTMTKAGLKQTGVTSETQVCSFDQELHILEEP